MDDGVAEAQDGGPTADAEESRASAAVGTGEPARKRSVDGAGMLRDLRLLGRLLVWSVVLMNVGDRMFATPVLAVAGMVVVGRMRAQAPTTAVRRGLATVMVLAGATAALAVATLVPGADAGSISLLSLIPFLLTLLAWALAMGSWSTHLGLDGTAARFRGAAFALAVPLGIVLVGAFVLLVTFGPGPVAEHGRTRPERFFGRPLDSDLAAWVLGTGLVSWILASLLLGVAAQWLRGSIQSAVDGEPPRWAGRTRARSSAG